MRVIDWFYFLRRFQWNRVTRGKMKKILIIILFLFFITVNAYSGVYCGNNNIAVGDSVTVAKQKLSGCGSIIFKENIKGSGYYSKTHGVGTKKKIGELWEVRLRNRYGGKYHCYSFKFKKGILNKIIDNGACD